MISRQRLIPRRTVYAVEKTVFTSSWATSWRRFQRQVFWLSDGQRDIQKIARLLHKPEASVGQVIEELAVSGYISVHVERVELMMDAGLLRQSFEMVIPMKEAFAHSFYERLFAYYPETRALFAQTDMKGQEGSLIATLAVVVAGVERGENIRPTLQELGKKHETYGAKPEHYPLVGGVLLETFHEYLGTRFTPPMESAWSQAYDIISGQMVAGA